ncbi:MAG: hypothetical protein JXB62_16275 [Pirellulales bacterium]|nr:hypothetical protein [Pirellulales bacterium]
MSQLLALEWDSSEARLVVAASRGETAMIEQAFSVELSPRQSGEETAEVDVGTRIAAALAARGVGRVDTLVAVGRSNIELRQLSLPPAPEEELPNLVRFQAMREFNELNEDWLLDFVPIGDATGGPQTVLAAAIGPELVSQIEQTCQTAGLKPRRLVLRPCAAASLLGRRAAVGPARPSLLVDLLSDEADLTVLVDQKVVFLRTARLTKDPLAGADQAGALLAEIRRTIAAAQNQMGGRPVESIVLCGRGEQHTALAELIEEHLKTATELYDPFTGLKCGRELRRALPENPGRFAPLLGMALAELEKTGHAIDFLHPRRPPEPPKHYARYLSVAALVVVLVAAFFGYRHWQRNRLETDIQELAQQSKDYDKLIARADKARAAVEELDKWSTTDVVWLDEIREISEKFRPAKEAMLTKLTLIAATPGGRMELEGLVDSALTIDALEEDLRDELHDVVGTGSSEESIREHYSWSFRSSVFVTAEDK